LIGRAPARVLAGAKNELQPGASDAVAGTFRPSHQRILDAFTAYGAMTPDELAEKIARSVFYTRPRCSELRAMGLLRPTGEVHCNALSGLKATVLTITR
jgi:hypothetical protein